jgi:hypothetical protein
MKELVLSFKPEWALARVSRTTVRVKMNPLRARVVRRVIREAETCDIGYGWLDEDASFPCIEVQARKVDGNIVVVCVTRPISQGKLDKVIVMAEINHD